MAPSDPNCDRKIDFAAARAEMQDSVREMLATQEQQQPPEMLCECGHLLDTHTEYEDVPCEGTRMAAPGSFISCECAGFRAAWPALGSRVRVHYASPTSWGGETGVVTALYETSAHVLMDASRTPVLFFLGELEPEWRDDNSLRGVIPGFFQEGLG